MVRAKSRGTLTNFLSSVKAEGGELARLLTMNVASGLATSVYGIEKKVIELMLSYLLLALGAIVFVSSIVLLLAENFGISTGWTLMIIALVILAGGTFFRMSFENTHRHRYERNLRKSYNRH